MSTTTPENPDESRTGGAARVGEQGGYGEPTPEQELGQGGRAQSGEGQASGEDPASDFGQRADADELAGEQRDPVTGDDLGPGEAESSA
jgi:hypothetical protein